MPSDVCRPRLAPPCRSKHEYERRGAWAYLAALDVHRAKVFGRCERKTGIAPFERLVEPSHAATPVQRGAPSVLDRGQWLLASRAPNAWPDSKIDIPRLVPVHGPVHASWLNQIEIYFSIVQRKVLTPNDFGSLAAVEERLLAFQDYYQALARPFAWTFTRRDLATLLNKLGSAPDPLLRMAA